jgi:hypothetical protein
MQSELPFPVVHPDERAVGPYLLGGLRQFDGLQQRVGRAARA